MNTITLWPHYKIEKLQGIKEIRDIFNDDEEETDWTLNWLVLSTSGVHGSYTTLDKLDFSDGYACITALIIHPRLVVLRYGEITIAQDDVPYLRMLVSKSLEGINKSQEGNKEANEKQTE